MIAWMRCVALESRGGSGGSGWLLRTFAAVEGCLPGVRGMLGAVTGRYVSKAF